MDRVVAPSTFRLGLPAGRFELACKYSIFAASRDDSFIFQLRISIAIGAARCSSFSYYSISCLHNPRLRAVFNFEIMPRVRGRKQTLELLHEKLKKKKIGRISSKGLYVIYLHFYWTNNIHLGPVKYRISFMRTNFKIATRDCVFPCSSPSKWTSDDYFRNIFSAKIANGTRRKAPRNAQLYEISPS